MTKTKQQKNKPAAGRRLLPALTSLALCLGSALLTYPAPLQAREMTEYPWVKLQSLDKVTAKTMTFEAKVGSTLKFGPLYMKVQSCQKSSPIDTPESAAFVQVWEIDTQDEPQWVFSGWMFASSPGLSPMNHPVYDVWIIDCLDQKSKEQDTGTNNAEPKKEQNENEAP